MFQSFSVAEQGPGTYLSQGILPTLVYDMPGRQSSQFSEFCFCFFCFFFCDYHKVWLSGRD